MNISLGVVMDPIQAINFKKDSTLAMLLEAQKREYSLFYMHAEDLFLEGDTAYAHVRSLKVKYDANDWFTLGEPHKMALAELNVILMRTDPPFNMNYIYATYLLERAEQAGTLVVNKPQSIRDCNEKLFATQFPQCCPSLVVSSDQSVLRAFHAEHKEVIFKPLDGMGGQGIFKVNAAGDNIGVIIETLSQGGKTPLMAQRYIPEITQGDKRILMIDGEPVPYALARIPSQNEHRGNLAAGGRGEARELSDRDRWICEQVGPTLKAKGLIFVGLDVIGDYLTEINVTSPTCIRELDDQKGLNISALLMDCIESKL